MFRTMVVRMLGSFREIVIVGSVILRIFEAGVASAQVHQSLQKLISHALGMSISG
jgi:hypothetical protein